MLDERKTAILRAVVQEYVSTGQPVGSSHIATLPSFKVSPATVRNEMAVLEQEGYLAQPHTSAGRIPTDKGYRLFVDTLAPDGQLTDVDVKQVGDFFKMAGGRLEDLLRHTSTLLANITHHTAVVVGPDVEAATVRAIHINRITSRSATVVVVLSNHSVENETLQLAEDVTDEHISEAVTHLNKHMIGSGLSEMTPFPSTNNAHIDSVCYAAVNALGIHRNSKPVFVGGAAALAQAFETVDVVRDVLQVIEQQYIVVSMVQDLLDRGLSVAIGAEHGVEPLATCSVVVAPVIADGEVLGSVGVLGPTRMNYPQALATVEVVSDHLGKRLSEN